MPLLKKKTFQKTTMPENLRDDEEVFYCAVTNEIFRDYEEFSERMFLCNSMVWTCSLTGKANLTYAEALESEENARKNLKEFPPELKIPIVYLASKTKRTAFGDMAEDIFIYAKDRFFIGENVETSFTGTKWKDSHVLQVIAPSVDQIEASSNNGNLEDHYHPSASLYKYEIEHLDADDEDISEIMIADCNQIRRKKGSFSRERCKLFLKQYVEQDDRGVFIIKPSAIESYKISHVNFEQIFDGPVPEFDASKKFEKVTNRVPNGKKSRQQSLHKFLTKSNSIIKNGNNVQLLEKLRKREEEYKLLKQQKKEEEMAKKQKKKEENMLLTNHLKDWYRPKEDLELVDQKKLPEAIPIKSKVPDAYFGDTLMVLEFVNSFSKFLSTKDFFPGGLTIDILERALTKNEVAGPLIDLIQMLLLALFKVQEEEASQYKTEIENPSSIKQEDTSNNMNLHEATRLATVASSWSKKYQGLPLAQLPLYSLTTSEILRLHLLSSGAIINFTGSKWRYQQRGGYTSEDDPGLYLRLHSPHILKDLGTHNVVELPISDKLEILSCLINQLLTYADVRDIVEERMEKVKQAKIDYRLTLAAERRTEQEFLTTRFKLKKSDKSNPNFENELRELETENKKKKAEYEFSLEKLKKASYDKQVLMGQDRAFRQYLKLESVPGFFINFEEDNPGICLNNIVKQDPNLVNAGRDETLAHIKKVLQDTSSSDKENSPSKSPKKVNGVHNSLQHSKSYDELLLCSANVDNCIVHSRNRVQSKWYFYHEQDRFDELIESLNKRGVRENELQQNLKSNKREIKKLIEATPVSCLNIDIVNNEDEEPKRKKVIKAKYEDANLGYSADASPEEILHGALVDNVLEMEDKIYAGCLGCLLIKDRKKWRSCLQTRNYKELDKTIDRRNKVIKQDNSEKNLDSHIELEDYRDPGQFLNSLHCSEVTTQSCDVRPKQSEELQVVIRSLAIALIQIAHAVEPKYLKKPLGRVSSGRNDKKKDNLLNMWERSLMAATSFSQIFLHYCTLDSCVTWGKSALLARCRICRRQNDSENMLLCDSCNRGHHLYCLKPKLKSVPPGDWFCDKCQKEKKAEDVVSKPYQKKRPIFRDEEIEEGTDDEEYDRSEENGDIKEDYEYDNRDDDDDDSNYNANEANAEPDLVRVELCTSCGSGGQLICCEKCSGNYHIECIEPPLRRAPRGSWLCTSCKKNHERKRHDNYSGALIQRSGIMNSQRRCAAKALYKIHDFAKSLRQLSMSDDSSEEEVISKRAGRREEGRTDLPLHNAALHEVLSEIMKDYNAWPFLRPVQKTEVPDYYDVITKPMDFGTIKYKLNMGEYHEDAEFMADAVLVFQNCNTYNRTDDDVYKCGVQLLKHFKKKCRELGLKLPEEMDYNDHSVRPKKKIRTK